MSAERLNHELRHGSRAVDPNADATVHLAGRDGVPLVLDCWHNLLHYAAFDVLWLNGKDLRGLPLTRRKRALERLIPATSTVLSRVFAVEGRGRDPFAAAERLDLEGIVAKRKADPYAPSTVWYKVKNRAYTQIEGRGELFHPKAR